MPLGHDERYSETIHEGGCDCWKWNDVPYGAAPKVQNTESEKFFAHLNNGEVSLVGEGEHLSYNGTNTYDSYRIVITPKKEDE